MTDFDKYLFYLQASLILRSHFRQVHNPVVPHTGSKYECWQLSWAYVVPSLVRYREWQSILNLVHLSHIESMNLLSFLSIRRDRWQTTSFFFFFFLNREWYNGYNRINCFESNGVRLSTSLLSALASCQLHPTDTATEFNDLHILYLQVYKLFGFFPFQSQCTNVQTHIREIMAGSQQLPERNSGSTLPFGAYECQF